MPMRLRASHLATASLITLLAAAPALAQQDVTVTNITSGDGYQLSVPTVVATGTTLTEAQIRRIFTGDFSSVAGALAELDARDISIPEMTLTYEVPAADGQPPQQATVVYRDFRLTDVIDGVAASTSLGESTVQSGDMMTMTMGPMTTGTFDIGALMGFYGLGAPAASEEFKTVYSDFTFAGATLAAGPDFACTIGPATVERFEARPLRSDMMAFTKLAMEAEAAEDDEVPPETVRKFVDFYVDILTAFRSTPSLAEGFECSGKVDEGNAIQVSSGAIQVGGFDPGIYPYLSVDNLHFAMEGTTPGMIMLENFTWKNMDFNGPIAAIQAATSLEEAWFEANWRKLVPAIEGLSLAGLSLDVPNPEGGENIKASLGAFDVTLADYVNGLPANLSISTEHLLIDVPDAEEGKMLRALGVTQLDLSQDIQLRWDRAANTIIVDSISIADEQLGSIKLSGVLGNATEQLFAEDNNIALVAAMGLTVQELTFDLDDRGLSTLLVGIGAAEQGQDPVVMRVGMAGLAQAMLLGLVGTTPEAMAASEQVANFIKTNPQLVLTLRATTDGGLPLPLLMAAADDPSVLAGQIAIEATASGTPRPADQPLALPQGGMTSDDDMADEMEGTEDGASDEDGAAPDDGEMSESQDGKRSLKN